MMNAFVFRGKAEAKVIYLDGKEALTMYHLHAITYRI